MKIVTTILTSSDCDACVRAYNSTEGERVIIVNTTDECYLTDVSERLPDATVIDTPSNGTPGQGKQSVIDWFLTSDYDYVIMLDGDDFFYPGYLSRLMSWITRYPANIYGLVNEDILYGGRYFMSWRDLDYDFILADLAVEPDVKAGMQSYMQRVFGTISQAGVPFHRIIMTDKPGAELFNYNTVMSGSEDVLCSAQLKYNHFLNNTQYHLVEDSEIYVYNKNITSGQARDMMVSDVELLESEFFGVLSPQVTEFLSNRYLPIHHNSGNLSDFTRQKLCKRIARGINR